MIGEVTSIGEESNGRITVGVHLEDQDSAPQNLLAGRMLTQNGKAFRILSHTAGSSSDSGQDVSLELRLPPVPSTKRPTTGHCSIALDASIPIKVKSLEVNDEVVMATLMTSALRAVPSSGLQDSRLTVGDIAATIGDVSRSELAEENFEMDVMLTLFWELKYNIPSAMLRAYYNLYEHLRLTGAM